MATSFTGLSEAQIDDKIIGSIQAVLPMLSAFSTQLDNPEGLVQGNSYKVPIMGALTVGNKTPGTLVAASGSLSPANVTASNFKGAGFEAIEGLISKRMMGSWWGAQVAEATKAVAATIVDGALGLVTSTNFATEVTVNPAAFTADDLASIRAVAKGKLKHMSGAFLCGSTVASRLITLQQVVLALAIADNRNSIADGKIPGGVVGYQAYEYVDMPSTLPAAVIGQGALAVVAGAPEQLITSGDGDVTYRRIITEPESGLSLQYTEAVSSGGKVQCEIAAIYGAAKALDAAVRVVAAAANAGA